jgi:four helix bundle protein
MIKGRLLKRKYDLEERTAVFAESIVVLVRQIKADHVNKSIISQLVRSAGSIGANYKEATEAESKKDFIHKVSISKKEIKETQHWLRLVPQRPKLLHLIIEP